MSDLQIIDDNTNLLPQTNYEVTNIVCRDINLNAVNASPTEPGFRKRNRMLYRLCTEFLGASIPTIYIIFIVGLSPIFPAVNLLYSPPSVLLVLAIGVALQFILAGRSYPSNIILSDEGIRFKFAGFVLNQTPVFPWNTVKAVEVGECLELKPFGAHKSTLIELNFNFMELSLKQKIAYIFLCKSLFDPNWKERFESPQHSIGTKYPLSIPLDLFSLETDKERFIEVMQRKIPESKDVFKTELLQSVNKIGLGSTALWLQDFSRSRNKQSERELQPGAILAEGRFELTSIIAHGGQAKVYEAEDKNSGRICALKEYILPVGAGLEIRNRAWEHVQREAELLSSLDNDDIVKTYGLFLENQRAYLVMERVAGKSLRQTVNETGSMSEVAVKDIGIQICKLLEYLHNNEPPLLHLDLSPDNFMIEEGRIKLIDFSVARRLETDATITVAGRHAYMPPEQFRGEPTESSDLYALGGTLYFLSIGKDPEPLSVSDTHKHAPNTSEPLRTFIRKITDQNISERFQSAKLARLILEQIVVH